MDNYDSNLEEVLSNLLKRQSKALHSASQFVLGEVTQLAPVATGNLKTSYHTKIDMKSKIAYIGTNVSYAPYLEFGTGIYAESGNGRKSAWAYKDENGKWRHTRGSRPQPHLRPAFKRDKIQKIIEREMKE